MFRVLGLIMQRSFDGITAESYDVLVIGGGITGAGAALDATLHGLRVALIDKGDFASGTSSASSKLIHGGLRYLELGQFRLVFEALAERRRLLQNAPHLVRPVRFVLPFYRGSRLPQWKGTAGLWLYEMFAGRDTLPRNRRRTVRQLCREFPCLKPAGLLGGVEYYDAQMDDARLCLEVIITACRRGARAANYVEAIGFETGAVRVRDQFGGGEGLIRARQVINAAGPWVDAVERLAGRIGDDRLRPTKGVHVVVPDQGLRAAFLLIHPADQRVFLVLPWMRRTLIGTTDDFTHESPDHLTVIPAEEAYLLEGFNAYFAPPLTSADVVGHFAGLRPLLKASSNTASATPRDFAVWDGPAGMLSVAGGKYTTYRHMAEVVTDLAARRLGIDRPCRTRQLKLDGAPAASWPAFAHRESAVLRARGLDATLARHLLDRYGRRAREVAAYILLGGRMSEPIVPGHPETWGELEYQREHEMAVAPSDYLLRRTRLGLLQHAKLADLTERLQAFCSTAPD